MMPANIQTRATIAARLSVPFADVAVLGWDNGTPVVAVPSKCYAQAAGMGLRAVACDSIHSLKGD